MLSCLHSAREVRDLILTMRSAFFRGENVMAAAREILGNQGNHSLATLISYDLQTGTYTQDVQANPGANEKWTAQIAKLLAPHLPDGGTVLEVGVGEATTLQGVLSHLGPKVGRALGFDISWSRLDEGRRWLDAGKKDADLFVGDLFSIPLSDNSVDVVYSSHSLEPNGGREHDAIKECLRVARKNLILIEPIYELVGKEAQERMVQHGYVRGLKAVAEDLGAEVVDYRLLDCIENPLNPSGVIALKKTSVADDRGYLWQCPVTGTPLTDKGDVFLGEEVGIAYPVLRGIPLLRQEHAVIAGKLR